ncbi:hypothetical protein B9Z55_007468 [Caenorhabditis nigoni]|uniref:BTB domain-containing protein n=1 Tax=Caenorhabditis nigoni TaxID=1611254 RepID=A0A2G5VA49_9PELO|nr:hypothetical protein B9Z55_007468 [Caenorhabditis nigoni]
MENTNPKNDEHLGMHLYANMTENQEIYADFTMKIFSKNKEQIHSKFVNNVFKSDGDCWDNWGFLKFIGRKILESDYLDDGKLEVEVHVKIIKMVGFPEEILGFPRKEMRSFGEEMQPFSDVVLKVKERKFFVLKLYLSSHSPYFAILFLGKFQDSEKSEIELYDIDPQHFQYYLEVLYGENGIDDDTVEGILSVADMYDTPLTVKKCEEFLVKKSKMELKNKLDLAGNYRLEELKKLCLDEIKSKEDIRSVIPEDPRKMDHEVLAELLMKAIGFN